MYLNILFFTLILFFQAFASGAIQEIRVKYECPEKYIKYYDRSFSTLIPYLEKKGLVFVKDNPDVIFCHEATSDILNSGYPVIILERHGTKLSEATLKVIKHKNVYAIFKNHVLRPLELYRKKTCMGLYFFKHINDYAHLAPLKPGIKIYKKERDKIYCVQWDFHLSNYTTRLESLKKEEIDIEAPRPIDVFFVGSDYFARATDESNLFYGWHRKKAMKAIKRLSGLNCLVRVGRPFSFDEYIDKIRQSKIVISPWGLSEWCFRDAEAMLCGAILIKPDTSFVQTKPDIFQNYRTYIPCKPDFSDLESIVYHVLSQYNQYGSMRKYAWRLLQDSDLNKLADHFAQTVVRVLKKYG